MRLPYLSFLILAIPSFTSAAPMGSYTGLSDIFGRDYVPTVVEKRDTVELPPNTSPYPHPSPSASGGPHYVSHATAS
jgi:hypothetical protein